MKMRVYEVRLRVDADNLTTVLDVVKDSADLISMTQVDEVATVNRRNRQPSKERPKGVSVQSVCLESLKPGARAIESIEKSVKENGFAITSARVAVNELVRNGRVRKAGEGIYELVPDASG